MFDGKKVLITGGTGSLGTALTNKLLETNIDVIRIFSRDELKQVQMKSNIPDKRLRFLIGDVRDKERLNRALEDIDIVIHAAALKHVPVVEYNPFEAVKTNVYGAQNLIEACFENDVEKVLAIGTDKAVAPFNTYGTTKKQGRIINISSIVGYAGAFGQVNYSASKAGIIGLTKTMAIEGAKYNILVNCIMPGYVKSGMTEKIPKTILENIIHKIPLKRLGSPDDVTNVIVFLSSEYSTYVTGEILCVDGGL